MSERLKELRDRLLDEYGELSYPVAWSTFMLGKVAQLEAQLEEAEKNIRGLQADLLGAVEVSDRFYSDSYLGKIYIQGYEAGQAALLQSEGKAT